MEMNHLFDRIEHLVRHRGGGSEWFARAFLSWHGLDDTPMINLNEVWRLDTENLELFIQLLRLPQYRLDEMSRARLVAINQFIKQSRGLP